jgi:predicted PurR-regulated permease PerM
VSASFGEGGTLSQTSGRSARDEDAVTTAEPVLRPRRTYIQAVGSLALTVAILYLAKEIIVPLALAVLLTFVLTPLVRAIELHKVHRVPAVLAVVLLAFCVVGVTGWVVGLQVRGLAAELPQHRHEIADKIQSLRGTGGTFGELLQMFRDLIEGPAPGEAATPQGEVVRVVTQPARESDLGQLAQAILPVLQPLATAGLVVILVVFMLVNREDLRDRLIGLFGRGQLTGTTRALDDAAQRLGSFLLAQLTVNAGFGMVFAIGLWLLGVRYAFLWGFLATVLRFVPYIGSWVAAGFPVLLSFALTPGWTQPLLVLAFFALLDLLTANVVEPVLFGHHTGVAPLALLVAAAFWTWVWGPVGLVLSTPLTVCLVVLGQHVPQMSFLALLLGDRPALAPHAGYYQRLLAKDKQEAKTRAKDYASERGLEKTFEDMILPALLRARQDWAQGGLTADEEEFAFQTTREVLAELADMPADKVATRADGDPESATIGPTGVQPSEQPTDNVPTRASVLVLGCPAHQSAEELTLMMLGRLLEPDGIRLDIMSSKLLPSEVCAQAEESKPSQVFIAVLAPGGLEQAVYLCKILRKRFAALPILVGYWGTVRNFDRLLVRLRRAGASYVTTTLLQSRSQIRSLAESTCSLSARSSRRGAAGLQPAGGASS